MRTYLTALLGLLLLGCNACGGVDREALMRDAVEAAREALYVTECERTLLRNGVPLSRANEACTEAWKEFRKGNVPTPPEPEPTTDST